MNSTSRYIVGSVMLTLLAATARAESPPTPTFSAILAHAPKKPETITLSGIQWTCTGTRCRGKGTTTDIEAACRALAGHMGQVKSFITSGKILADCRTPPAAPPPAKKPPPAPAPAVR